MYEVIMTVSDPPNRWTVLNEYSKTIIALASALLAVAVAFADKLLGASPSYAARFVVYGMWFFLLVSIVTGLLVAAFVYKYLELHEKDDKEEKTLYEKRARKMANWSYRALGLAVILIFIFGFLVDSKTSTATESANLATEVLIQVKQAEKKDLIVDKLKYDTVDHSYTITVKNTKENVTYSVIVDTKNKRVISLQ